MLIKGSDLTPVQKTLVLNAFCYRWTHENLDKAKRLMGDRAPTMEPVSDSEWLATHAFHFVKDGSRLMYRRQAEYIGK